MKKIIAIASVAGFLLSASSASAFMIIDGQPVFGFDRNHKEVSLAAPSEKVEQAPYFAPAVFGNTSILDMMVRLKPEDQKTFLKLVEKAGIRY